MGIKVDTLYWLLKVDPETLKSGLGEAKASILDASGSFGDFARKAEVAFESSAAGAAFLAASVVAVAVAATHAASELHDAFLPLQSTININAAEFKTLKDEIEELSQTTPRTAESLAGVAGELAKMGEANPAELAKDVRTLALAGDALGQVDLKPFADTLDLLGDGFNLNAEQARQAFIQIVAITHGKIGMDEFASVLDKSATKMHALNISAQESAAAITVLIDKGVNKRQVTTGLIDLLEKSSNAEKAAVAASAEEKEGTASALRTFAATVNGSTIASKGLVGALGDLFRAFDGNTKQLQQAGLNTNEIAIAQKAAEATANGAKVAVLSYNDALAQLTRSAEVNRQSAGQLYQLLKNDLSIALVALGDIFLPKVIAAMNILADLFSKTHAAATEFREGLKDVPAIVQGVAKGSFGANTSLINFVDQSVRKLEKRPQLLEGLDDKELTQFSVALGEVAKQFKGADISATPLYKTIVAVNAEFAKRQGVIDAAEDAKKLAAAKDASAKALADEGQKAHDAKLKFDELTRSSLDYASSLTDAGDPLNAAKTKIASITEQLNKQVEAITDLKERAKARAKADTIIDQLATGFDHLSNTSIEKFNNELTELAEKLAPTTAGAIAQEYKQIVDFITKEGDAARKAAEATDDLNDKQTFTAVAEEFEKRKVKALALRDALIDLASVQSDVDDASAVLDAAAAESAAGYQGRVVSIEDYRNAIARLQDDEVKAQAVIKSTTATEKEKAAARKVLADVTERLKKLEGTGASSVDKTGDSAIKLGSGLAVAAQNALTLVQALGQGGTKLAQMLSAAISLGQGLKGIGDAQKDNQAAADSGKALSTVGTIASYVGPVGQVVGGIVSVVGAIGSLGDKAKERAAALKQAAIDFNKALADFAIDGHQELSDKLTQNFRDATALANQATATHGGTSSGFDFKSVDEIQAYIDKLNHLGPAVKPAFQSTIDDLQKIADTAKANAAALEKAHTDALAAATGDLQVQELLAQGRTAEAEALKTKLAQDKAIADAELDTTDAGKAYLAFLKQVQKEQNDAADAAERAANAQKIFTDQVKVFALTGKDYLDALVKYTHNQLGAAADFLDGLDLSTQDGLDGLKAHIQDLFKSFSSDGVIDDSEQKILDSLFDIYTAASDTFDKLANKVQRSLSKLGDDNDILGGSNADKFTRTVGASKGFNKVLDDILGSVDISTSAGADALRTKLQALYTQLAQDGVSDEEVPIVELIKQLLSSLGSAVDEATNDANKKIADAETARQRRLSDRKSNADVTAALNDDTGAAAFSDFLGGLAPALGDLFSQFDVTKLQDITAAKDQLKALYASVKDLSDEEIMAQFGVTRDELINGIVAIDSSLDNLASTAKDSANTILNTANALKDLNASIDDEFLRASGNDRQADINQANEDRQKKLDEARALGVSDSQLKKINDTFDLKIKAINEKYDAAAATANAALTGPISNIGGGSDALSSSGTLSSVTSISSVQAISLIGYAQSQLIVLQSIDALLQRIFGGGPTPQLLTPALSTSALNRVAGNTSVQNQYILTITIEGGVQGVDPDAVGKALAAQTFDHLDQMFALQTSNLRALSGNVS